MLHILVTRCLTGLCVCLQVTSMAKPSEICGHHKPAIMYVLLRVFHREHQLAHPGMKLHCPLKCSCARRSAHRIVYSLPSLFQYSGEEWPIFVEPLSLCSARAQFSLHLSDGDAPKLLDATPRPMAPRVIADWATISHFRCNLDTTLRSFFRRGR